MTTSQNQNNLKKKSGKNLQIDTISGPTQRDTTERQRRRRRGNTLKEIEAKRIWEKRSIYLLRRGPAAPLGSKPGNKWSQVFIYYYSFSKKRENVAHCEFSKN